MNLEDIILSEISQSEKEEYCMISLKWRGGLRRGMCGVILGVFFLRGNWLSSGGYF